MTKTCLPAWLVLDGVSFAYGRGPAVNQSLNLTLGPGIVGLLGPNGAGKSTLMRMLATLARPRSGRILWRGTDIAREPDALRATLGYLPQDFGVYPALSAREFLTFLAAVKGLPSRAAAGRVDECLAQVGLLDVADRALAGYSGGMRQRVGIAQALLNDPQLLVVDEPTVGLDPAERVLAGLAGAAYRYEVVLRIQATVEQIRTRLPAGLANVAEPASGEGADPDAGQWLRVELRVERLDWLPPLLASLDRPFVVESPDELRELVLAFADRLTASARRSVQ